MGGFHTEDRLEVIYRYVHTVVLCLEFNEGDRWIQQRRSQELNEGDRRSSTKIAGVQRRRSLEFNEGDRRSIVCLCPSQKPGKNSCVVCAFMPG